MVEERCGLGVLTRAAREDVVITRWLMLCDALTFPVGPPRVGFILTASLPGKPDKEDCLSICRWSCLSSRKERGLASGSRVRFRFSENPVGLGFCFLECLTNI